MAIPPCLEQQELLKAVLGHLEKLSQLAQAAKAALGNGNEKLAFELDAQVESELGAKERAMGALRQHRIEHGC